MGELESGKVIRQSQKFHCQQTFASMFAMSKVVRIEDAAGSSADQVGTT
jgi:hypothetical protein